MLYILLSYEYCSLFSVGFGDICPGDFSDPWGDVFLLLLPLLGLGFFCGPMLTMTSTWQHRVPGGVGSLGSLVLAFGVSMFTIFEGMELKDAIHLSIHIGRFAQSWHLPKLNTTLSCCRKTNRLSFLPHLSFCESQALRLGEQNINDFSVHIVSNYFRRYEDSHSTFI